MTPDIGGKLAKTSGAGVQATHAYVECGRFVLDFSSKNTSITKSEVENLARLRSLPGAVGEPGRNAGRVYTHGAANRIGENFFWVNIARLGVAVSPCPPWSVYLLIFKNDPVRAWEKSTHRDLSARFTAKPFKIRFDPCEKVSVGWHHDKTTFPGKD